MKRCKRCVRNIETRRHAFSVELSNFLSRKKSCSSFIDLKKNNVMVWTCASGSMHKITKPSQLVSRTTVVEIMFK